MLLIELTEDNAPASVPGGAVYELAISLGISSRRGRRLRVMIDELVSLAQEREHGDGPPEVRVRAWLEAGHLRVEVSDQGIPVFTDDAVLPHELVRLGFAELLDFQSHGRDGNIARCSLALEDHDARDALANQETVLAEDAPEIHAPGEFVVRPMRADECDALARLVYRCYGYDYPSEDIYFPETMTALVNEGLMHSAVVVNDEGVLVGHAALTKSSKESQIAEAGKLVVDPRYRSHGLAKKLAQLRLDRAAELELYGLWTECVSNHPYSQRNQLKLGAVESGILLGLLPASVKMVGMENEAGVRGSLVSMYLPLAHAPRRTLHAPPRYRETLEEIAHNLELQRDWSDITQPESGPSRLSVSLHQAWSMATITVEVVGEDFLEQLDARLTDLLDMHTVAIYLDLPLSAPGTAHFGDHLAGMGFFFSALLPESCPSGDCLRLQLLDHEQIPTDHVKLASDWGAKLLAMCVADQERVAAQMRSARLVG